MYSNRVLSGMRPTGRLHLGHYHGVLENWLRLQNEYQCLFFVADWHALTTHYETPHVIEENARDMVIDWLAAGVDPAQATLFVQSRVIEHAELHLLLSMMTPLGWLERVPTYKDQQEKLTEKDLSTYGFLGYPLLMSADILIYRANLVPVGEDQIPHIEFTRELARRFNHMYGREPGFEDKARAAVKKLGSKKARLYEECRTAYREKGDDEALLTEASKMPGLDGQKMSKSYSNTIALREDPDMVAKKIRTMPTDPARVRRTDAGNPANCPVWQFHLVYSDDGVRQWVTAGCTSAGIGCIECKQPVIDAVLAELAPIRERAQYYEGNPDQVRNILADGCEKAQEMARDTMRDVRESMGLTFS